MNAEADDLVDEAIDVGHGRTEAVVVHAKMLRLELLGVKTDLERKLEDLASIPRKPGRRSQQLG